VEVRPRSLLVANRTTGEVHLYGTLEATVIADQTTWTLVAGGSATGSRAEPGAEGLKAASGGGKSRSRPHGGSGGGSNASGAGSGGGGGRVGDERLAVVVTLVKMRPADGAGSEGWWRRCLEGAPEVCWEEVSERDYSTMPAERLEVLRQQQAGIRRRSAPADA
jgi:hypothetical protein